MSALRILVADDHEVVRRGLCALLKSHAGWEVCAEAADGREAVDKAQRLKPDIVILDIGMPSERPERSALCHIAGMRRMAALVADVPAIYMSDHLPKFKT